MLFGIDKVRIMQAGLYATQYVNIFNKDKYAQMSAAQKKVIDDHCTTEWATKFAGPWADFEHNGIAKIKAEPGPGGLSTHQRPARVVEEGGRAADRGMDRQREKEDVDGEAALKEFKAIIAKEKAGFVALLQAGSAD